jgi:succinate dehydrogenase subunit C
VTGSTEYLPKTYRAPLSTYWWSRRWPYLKFILREASSVFVGWFVVLTLMQIRALSRGPVDYASFQAWLQNPLVILLNAISLLFVVFHAVTWFNLAPKAMAVRMGGKRLPGIAIALPNFVGWVVVSAAVAWIVLRG